MPTTEVYLSIDSGTGFVAIIGYYSSEIHALFPTQEEAEKWCVIQSWKILDKS